MLCLWMILSTLLIVEFKKSERFYLKIILRQNVCHVEISENFVG